MSQGTERIRLLNDQLRTTRQGGQVFMTPGIAALGEEAVSRLLLALTTFDDFCEANDPYQEHDFGPSSSTKGAIFFKIDYYDNSLAAHSLRPSRSSCDRNGSSLSCWRRSISRSYAGGPLVTFLPRRWGKERAPNNEPGLVLQRARAMCQRVRDCWIRLLCLQPHLE